MKEINLINKNMLKSFLNSIKFLNNKKVENSFKKYVKERMKKK